jgi:Protein of unknown function (DUF2946)
MGLVRLHRRCGAWLGFAALALQIVLSFGHVHVGNVHVDAVWRRVDAAVAKSTATSRPLTLAQTQQKSPTHDSGQGSGDPDDYCAICASIYLASTSLAAQPPLLLLPSDFEHFAPEFDAAFGLSVSRPAFFQPRAPPRA